MCFSGLYARQLSLALKERDTMRRYKSYNMDPRIIQARFDGICKETGKVIKKGQDCVYYPKAKSIYHMESKTAHQFNSWHEDVFVLGHNY